MSDSELTELINLQNKIERFKSCILQPSANQVKKRFKINPS